MFTAARCDPICSPQGAHPFVASSIDHWAAPTESWPSPTTITSGVRRQPPVALAPSTRAVPWNRKIAPHPKLTSSCVDIAFWPQVLDCGPHLVAVPRRPGLAVWQSCHAGAPPCRGDADRQAFGPVLLAERQELRRQRDRRQLASAGSSFSAHAVVWVCYQPTLARPSSPLLVPLSVGLSRRCASTPTWNVSLSFFIGARA